MDNFSSLFIWRQLSLARFLVPALVAISQISYAKAQTLENPYGYQSQGFTVFTPGEATSTGGYATQATQAGQATQAQQVEGYVSPYSPSQPYRPTLPTSNIIESSIPTYNVQTYSTSPLVGVTSSETPTTTPIQPRIITGVTGSSPETSTGGNTLITIAPKAPSIVTQTETAVPAGPSSAENIEASPETGDTEITVEQPAVVSEENGTVSQGGGEVRQEKKKKEPGMTLQQVIAMRKASEERARRNLVREDVAPISSVDTVREWSGPNLNNLITQVGEMVRAAGNRSLALIRATTLAIVVNPIDIESAADKEDKEREDAKKKLLEELKELKKKMEKAKRLREEELEREKNDRKYKARKDAEKKLEDERKELERKNRELKEKAAKHEEDGEDLDQEEKNLREMEDEMRRDGDPNCRSSACQNIRRLRAENQADKINHQKAGDALQQEAKQFNQDVRDYREASQELEELKDRGFGMNEEEMAAREADQRVQELADREAKIKLAIEDLRERANRQNGFEDISQEEAAEFRKQMRGLEGLLETNDTAQDVAEKTAFVAEAVALGLDATAAQEAYDENNKNIPEEFQSQIDEAKLIRGMDSATLEKSISQYDTAIGRLGSAENALASGEIPKGGPPDSLAEYNQLADRFETLDDEQRNLGAYSLDLKNRADNLRAFFDRNKRMTDRSAAEGLTRDEIREKLDELEREESNLTGRILELQDQTDDIRMELRGLLPVVEADIFSRRVGLLNTEIANGLPLGEDGNVDRIAFGNNVAAVADQQMQLAQLGGELDAVMRRLSALHSQSGLTSQQAQQAEVLSLKRDQLSAQYVKILDKLDTLGVSGSMDDGKFVPTPTTRAGAITWNTARDQVVDTFKAIEENRRKIASETNKKISLGDLPSEPAKSGKGTIQKILDRDRGALEQFSAVTGGIGGAVIADFIIQENNRLADANLVKSANLIERRLSVTKPIQKSDEVIRLEKSISGIDDSIEAIETTMVAARSNNSTWLEHGLSIQRETLFSSRAVLEKRLDQEQAKVQKKIAYVQTRTRTESPKVEKLKQALSNLDLNISAVSTVEEAVTKSGNENMSRSYRAQIQALEASREQVAKSLERQRTVEKEKIKNNPRGLNTIDRLLGRSETVTPVGKKAQAASVPETALNNKKTEELSKAIASLTKSIETVETTMLVTERSKVPGLKESLDAQREVMFAGRDSLEEQLDVERARLRALAKKSIKEDKENASSEIKTTPQDLELALDENIKAFDSAAAHYRANGNNNLAQVFETQKAALETEKNRIIATQASYSAREDNEKSRVELEAVSALVLWINKDILPAFPKEDPARRILPGVIAEITQRFGAEVTEQLLDEALDELVDNGLKPDGAVLLDAIFRRVNRELSPSSGQGQEKVSEKPRLKFLAEILTTRKKGTNDQETAYLKASYDRLKSKLEAKHHEKFKVQGASPLSLLTEVSSLVDLASLPGTDPKQFKPLISQLQRQLERVEKGMRNYTVEELGAVFAEANLNTRRLLAQIQKTMSKGNEKNQLTSEITRQLVKINEMRAVVFGRQFSTEKSKKQENLRKDYAISRLEQVRNLVNSGSLADAMTILKELETENRSIQQSKALALIDIITQIEQRYGFLNESEKEKLGKLSDLRALREGALKEFITSAKDPKMIAGISLHWSERLLREGKFFKAGDVLDKALVRKPNDPSLLGLKLRVSLAKQGKEATPELLKSLLENIPENIRLEVAGTALNGFVEQGEHVKVRALIKLLKSTEGLDEAAKQRLNVQLDFAEISVMASGLGTTQNDQELKKKLRDIEKRLLSTPGLEESYKKALVASTKRLIKEIDKAAAWNAAIEKSGTSADELGFIAKRAVNAGRYDIAGTALQKQITKLLNENGPKEIGSGFIQAVRLLDGIRMRAQDPRLTQAHREIFAAFLKTNGAAINKKLGDYFAERIASAAKSARVKGTRPQGTEILEQS